MSMEMYRRQASQIQSGIVRLLEQKAREAQKAAEAGVKALTARTAASRASSVSSLQSKTREATRYADDQVKLQREVAKLEKKIADEQKKLGVAQAKLDSETAKTLKIRNAEQMLQLAAQRRQFSTVESNLHHHESLHRQTIARVDRLSALPEKIVVAFFATDPATASDRRLLLDEEVREIHQKIRLSDHRDAVKLESRWALRPGDILQYMNELKPTIVHFSGHGTAEDELVLQDRNGDATYVSLESIVKVFEHFDSVRLLFFNTCHSYKQAASCTTYVDAAIGMNQEIGDAAARVFAAQFYSAIGFGKSIPIAFEQAKNALVLEGIKEELTPELHLREGVEEDQLVLVSTKGAAAN